MLFSRKKIPLKLFWSYQIGKWTRLFPFFKKNRSPVLTHKDLQNKSSTVSGYLLNAMLNTIIHDPLQMEHSHGQKLSLAHKSVVTLAHGHESIPILRRPCGWQHRYIILQYSTRLRNWSLDTPTGQNFQRNPAILKSILQQIHKSDWKQIWNPHKKSIFGLLF